MLYPPKDIAIIANARTEKTQRALARLVDVDSMLSELHLIVRRVIDELSGDPAKNLVFEIERIRRSIDATRDVLAMLESVDDLRKL